MADNYEQFSEQINGLTAKAMEWCETVLGYDVDEKGLEGLKALLNRGGDIPELEEWPGFCWRTDGIRMSEGSIWLYSEENYNAYCLQVFVHELIKRFMPDYVFTLTSAGTCSKPRIGEFGGTWFVISREDIEWGTTWDAAKKGRDKIFVERLSATDHGDECPLCKNGTVEHVDGKVRCRGECGAEA